MLMTDPWDRGLFIVVVVPFPRIIPPCRWWHHGWTHGTRLGAIGGKTPLGVPRISGTVEVKWGLCRGTNLNHYSVDKVFHDELPWN